MTTRHILGQTHGEWIAALTALLLLAVVSPGLAQAEPPADLTVDQMHLFLLPAGDRLQVTEHYLLGNAGAETYTGDAEGITVFFPLPEEATDIRFEEGREGIERYVVRDNGIGDTAAIPSGSATVEVRFAYEIPLELNAEIVRTVPLPVKSAVLLIAGAQWALGGEELAPLGSMEVGGQPAQAYTTVEPLDGGESFSFVVIERAVEPVTGPEPAQQQPNPTRDLGLGIIALAAAAVAGFMLWRSPRVPEVPEAIRADIAAIAALDEQFAAGEVSEEAYREARDALKATVETRLRGIGADDL
ncbi:MAG: hypothetical protein ACP5JG_15855 [Anaerolineae bacterium]